MPRPKNYALIQLFNNYGSGRSVACFNGSCSGKLLNTHGANLERHLKKVHPELYARYIDQKYARVKALLPVALKPPNVADTSIHTQLELAIVDFFAKNPEAMHFIRDHAFKLLMQPAFGVLDMEVTQANIVERIEVYFEKWKRDTIQELQGNLLSLKIDAIESQDVEAVGINVQYMADKCVQVKTLAIKEFQFRHCRSQGITLLIQQVLNEYDIDWQQNVTVTVDVRLSDLQSLIDSTANDIRLSLRQEWDHTLTEVLNIEEQLVSTTANITAIRCGAYTLHLCIQDVINNPCIQKILEEFHIFTEKQKYPKHLDREDTTAPACITKWNCTFETLKTLLEIEHTLDPLSGEIPGPGSWKFLKEFVTILNPLQEAAVKLQTEQQSISDLYIIIMDVLFKIKDLPSSDVKSLLSNSLTTRKAELFALDLFNAAIYLDPRIKICLNAEQKERAKRYIMSLHTRLESLKNGHVFGVTEMPIKRENLDFATTSNRPSSPNSFSEFLLQLDPDSCESITCSSAYTDLEHAIKTYERQPRLPLDLNLKEHWSEQQNCLSVIAETILAIPVTPASTGRVLSAVKHLSANKRGDFPAATVEHMMMVHVNGDFSYDDVDV